MSGSDHPQGRDDHSNPPRATDAEDERWVGEGGGSTASAYGAGKDGRDRENVTAENVSAADAEKAAENEIAAQQVHRRLTDEAVIEGERERKAEADWSGRHPNN